MIRLHTDMGALTTDFTPGLTTLQMVTNIKAENDLEIRGTWSVQETQTGRTLSPYEEIVDSRIYHLNAAIKPKQMRQPNIIQG